MGRAFVFPGQGAQAIGMGRALAEAYPAAQAVFDEVDAALGENLSGLIWEGDIAELTLTANAQPALMATSMAAMAALAAEGIDVSHADYVAGHSLGASGVQEAIYSLLMVENDFIQASANIDNLDEAARDMPIVTERKDNVELNTVMSNNFGFGGTNACLVLQKYNG